VEPPYWAIQTLHLSVWASLMSGLSNLIASVNETKNVVFRILVGLNGIVEAFDGKSRMKILVWDTMRRLSADNTVVQVHPCYN
jgi:hypothetical protein